MRILPAKTAPSSATPYRHSPREGKYATYRKCLRWDFGFTCAFCLLHEADFTRIGQSDGFGLTSIEHILPQSEDEDAKNIYSNCVYCCMFCNRSRSNTKITDDKGRRLLNPTNDPWDQHFYPSPIDDRLLPNSGDADAQYTQETYDINDPQKIALRKMRRTLYEDHLEFLRSDPLTRIDRLLELAVASTEPTDVKVLVTSAQDLRTKMKQAIDQLSSYAAIPADAPARCRCGVKTNHTLPACVLNQSFEL